MAKNIAVFASGNGSNALQIIKHFGAKDAVARVALVVSNNAQAGVIRHAEAHGIPFLFFNNTRLRTVPEELLSILEEYKIDFIVLAGFLALVPAALTSAFAERLLNIHPALLPHYGGKGMYGSHVHKAVIVDGCAESGITIHRVNERYDEGEIVHQARVSLAPDETAESLQLKIQELEHYWYPRIVEKCIREAV